MNILLVDRRQRDLLGLKRYLQLAGHNVQSCYGMAQAVSLFHAIDADLVFASALFADIEQSSFISEIEKAAAPRYVLFALVNPELKESDATMTVHVGNRIVLVLPTTGPGIENWIETAAPIVDSQRGIYERTQELEKFRALQEEERNTAVRLIEKLINTEKLRDPALRYWISPAESFSGDLIAAARTPSGVLHALLADSTGHGLVAAINTVPMVGPFYGMTDKGYSISTIAAEMNRKLKAMNESHRFVATTLLSMNFSDGVLRVWNGGNPAAVLFGKDRSILHRFESRHLPLGILDDRDFDDSVETFPLRERAQLVMYSDGLTEAVGVNGTEFGEARLLDILQGTNCERGMESIIYALDEHLQSEVAHDDVSVAVIDCKADSHYKLLGNGVAHDMVSSPTPPGQWSLCLKLSHYELRQKDTVPVLMNIANQFENDANRSAQLFVILSELFNNSLDHGLLLLDSTLKGQTDGTEQYLALRRQRLAQLDHGEIEISLQKVEHEGQWCLKIKCRDTGAGFDVERQLYQQEADHSKPYGRGLHLLRSMAVSVNYNDCGNEATVVL